MGVVDQSEGGDVGETGAGIGINRVLWGKSRGVNPRATIREDGARRTRRQTSGSIGVWFCKQCAPLERARRARVCGGWNNRLMRQIVRNRDGRQAFPPIDSSGSRTL